MTQVLILPNKDLKHNYYRYVNKLREKYMIGEQRANSKRERETLNKNQIILYRIWKCNILINNSLESSAEDWTQKNWSVKPKIGQYKGSKMNYIETIIIIKSKTIWGHYQSNIYVWRPRRRQNEEEIHLEIVNEIFQKLMKYVNLHMRI